MYHRNRIYLFNILLFISVMISMPGCEKEPAVIEGSEEHQNFIPQGNKKYIYDVADADGPAGIATQWLSDRKDSAGIAIFNLHTTIEVAGGLMTLNNQIFSKEGKTYTEMKVSEAWYQTVALLGTLPKVMVTKSEVFGYPAYMTMDNAVRKGSKLSKDGPPEQGQVIEYINDGRAAFMEQKMVLISGESDVETIEVPAGSFACNRFGYEMVTTIKNKTDGKEYTGNGEEHITVWMAHGIGIVKQQSISQLVTLVPLPNGEIKEIVTKGTSTTTLREIN